MNSVPKFYGDLVPRDSLTARLFGKQVKEVISNGHLLKIVMADNSEVTIAWLDSEGRPLKGKPVITQSGARIKIEGLQDALYFPNVRTRGEA